MPRLSRFHWELLFLGALMAAGAALLAAGSGKGGLDLGLTEWSFSSLSFKHKTKVQGLLSGKELGELPLEISLGPESGDKARTGSWSGLADGTSIAGVFTRKNLKAKKVVLTVDEVSAGMLAEDRALGLEQQLADQGVDAEVEVTLTKSKLTLVFSTSKSGWAEARLTGKLWYQGTAAGDGFAATVKTGTALAGASRPVDARDVVVPSSPVVTGTVRVSGGDPQAPDADERLPGLVPVPDGTPVTLVRLDAGGAVVQTLSGTTTKGADYRFKLKKLGVDLSADLAVVGGGPATGLRALLVRSRLDVDPLSEAAARLVIDQGTGLDGFRPREADDVLAAVELLARVEGLVDQGDNGTTVAALLQAASATPSLQAFVAAAAAPGQTAEGPGDIGDLFPHALGDTWIYQGQQDVLPADEAYENAAWIASVDDAGVFELVESNPWNSQAEAVTFERETTAALLSHGSDRPWEDILGGLAPYEQVRFPLRSDEVIVLEVEDVPVPDLELDQDDDEEAVDARVETGFVGFEDVSVPAGDFPHCARIDTSSRIFLEPSGKGFGGKRIRLLGHTSRWFAPGVGLVRAEHSLQQADQVWSCAGGWYPDGTENQTVTEVLVSWQVAG